MTFHLLWAPGRESRATVEEAPQQGLESQREIVPGQLGSLSADGWQLARSCVHQLQDRTMDI